MLTSKSSSPTVGRGAPGGVLAALTLAALSACQSPAVTPAADGAAKAVGAPASAALPPKQPSEIKSSSYRITDISVSAGDLGGAAPVPPGTVIPTAPGKAPPPAGKAPAPDKARTGAPPPPAEQPR